MRRDAKASTAGSTSGIGSSRRLFGRAAAIRGVSSDYKGSGAPSLRLGLAPLLALAAALALLAPSLASAATPTVSIDPVTPAYSVAEVEGEVDPADHDATACHFDYVADPDFQQAPSPPP